jgi:hypothetical protein
MAEISVPSLAEISVDTEMSENCRNRHFGIGIGRKPIISVHYLVLT